MKATGSRFVVCALAVACESRPAPAPPTLAPAPSPPALAVALGNPFAGADRAVRAVMGPGGLSANLRPPTALDLDGDGAMEGLFNDASYGCYLAVRRGGAWVVSHLDVRVGHNERNARCLEPLRVGARTILVAKGSGEVRDAGTAAGVSASLGYSLWALVGGEARALWSDENADAESDDELRFAALRDNGLAVGRREHGVTVHRALVFTPAGTLRARSCWGPTAPSAVPEALAGCSARPTRGDRLYATEAVTTGDAVDLSEVGLVNVLHAGAARRGATRAYCVVSTDGEHTGYMYLRPTQLAGCPAFP